jgi:hypothetical protein
MPTPLDPTTRVLGLRLTYLSRHEGVRQTILERVQNGGEDVRAVARSISVTIQEDGQNVVLTFDVLGDDKSVFVENLNRLVPGPPAEGDSYSTAVGDYDEPERRNHDWSVWDESLTDDAELSQQLRDAVIEVLTHNQPVTVYGENAEQMEVDARDSGDPQLVFRVAPQDSGQG